VRDKSRKLKVLVTYECICCSTPTFITTTKSTSYQNVAQHVYSNHKDYPLHMGAATPSVWTIAKAVSDRATNVSACLHWLVMDDLAFNVFENPCTKKYVGLNGFAATNARKYLGLVTTSAKHEIARDLPKHIGIMLDGWSCRNEHYLAVFAVFVKDGGVSMPLLAMAFLHGHIDVECDDDDDVRHGANEHAHFLSDMLLDYGGSLVNVDIIVADTCSVNRRLSKDIKKPMVSCASHRLNLAVKTFMAASMMTSWP